MKRQQHLQWCKDRAIGYFNKGQIAEGIASFTSDMAKHPETNDTLQNGFSHPLIMSALFTNDQQKCIDCVNGFN